MKKVLGSMSKFIFAGFGIAVLALLMSLTYGALQKLFPNSFSNQMWGLVMFDIAAMCWAIAFVFQSKSTGQYAAAGIGFIVAFVGTLLMVAYEVVSSGQSIANVDVAQLGRWVVYGFIIVTAIHAGLIYAHHALSPEISEQINVGVARGEVVTQAITDATKTIESEKHDLSRAIYYDIVSQVKRDLGLHPVDDTIFDRRNNNRFNLDVNMPQEEWEQLEADLQDKGYLNSSNVSGAKKDRLSDRLKRAVNRLRRPKTRRYEQAIPSPVPDEVKAMYAPGTRFNDGTQNPVEPEAEPSYHPVSMTPQPRAHNYRVYDHHSQVLGHVQSDNMADARTKAEENWGKNNIGGLTIEEDAPAPDVPFPGDKQPSQ